VREVPQPALDSTEVLVRNAYSAISAGTERARVGSKSLVQRGRERPDLAAELAARVIRDGPRETVEAVRRKLQEETAGGYSSAGTVIAVGGQVRGFAPGDHVACAGVGHANHAELVTVPANLCAHVPDGVDLRVAALTTIAAIALHAIRLSEVRIGERVAVIGSGLIGRLACQLLRTGGAEVFALDVDPARAQQALAAGAHHALAVDPSVAREVRARSKGIGVDHAIVTAAASSSAPILLALDVVRDRGSVTLVGDVPITMPREQLYRKELRFRVSRSYGPGRYDTEYEEHGLDYPIAYVRWTEQRNMEAVLELQARGQLSLIDLIAEVVPVEHAAEAFARLQAQGAPGAVLLSYPDHAPERIARPGRPGKTGNATITSRNPRVGLIGPGGFARAVLVPAFQAAGAVLDAVAGGTGLSAERAVRELGFTRSIEDVQTLIDDPELDVVVIASRHHNHAALARDALLAGKHVFCEKPLALTAAELDEVLAAAAASDRVLAVGFNRRFSPLLTRMSELRRAETGPVTIVCRVSVAELPAQDWQNDPLQGGGRLLGEGCHFLDCLRFLAGSDIVSVHATGHARAELARMSTDNVVISLQCADGSIGTIAYIARSAPRVGKERIELFAGGGIAILDDFCFLHLHRGSTVKRVRTRSPDKGHRAEVEAFLDGVSRGRPPIPLGELENSSRATLAAVESLLSGEPIAVRQRQ
jgi:predicted dehydrogenase